MKRVTRLTALALFIAACASAEFSDAEKNELKKIVRARLHQAKAVKRIGAAIENDSNESNRSSYYLILNEWIWAYFGCGFMFGNWVNSPPSGSPTPDRVTRVSQARNSLDSCKERIQRTRDAIAPMSATSTKLSQADFLLSEAAAELASFDETLPYLDWEPTSYPRIVGPHGDYDYGQQMLMRTHEYFSHTIKDVIEWYGHVDVFPDSAKSAMSSAFKNAWEATEAHARGWALASKIVLADDEADILADEAAGSGLRPFEFFIEPLAIEYLYNKETSQTNFAGRNLKAGAPRKFFAFSASFMAAVARAAEVNDGDEVRLWLLPGGGKTFSKETGIGRVFEHVVDLGDFWKDHDNYAAALQVFFHEIVPPPPSGGDGKTCGPGTNDDNGDDVCEPDPCPTFVPEIVLLDGVTAQAQCLEVSKN